MPYPALQSTVRPALPEGPAVVLARRLRARSPTTRSRPTPGTPRNADRALPMHLYPIDGAAHRVGADRHGVGLPRRHLVQVIVGVDPDPANAEASKVVRDYWEATHPYSAGGAYVNFMMDEGQDRVRASYGETTTGSARSRRNTTRRTSSGSTRTSRRRAEPARVAAWRRSASSRSAFPSTMSGPGQPRAAGAPARRRTRRAARRVDAAEPVHRLVGARRRPARRADERGGGRCSRGDAGR